MDRQERDSEGNRRPRAMPMKDGSHGGEGRDRQRGTGYVPEAGLTSAHTHRRVRQRTESRCRVWAGDWRGDSRRQPIRMEDGGDAEAKGNKQAAATGETADDGKSGEDP